MSENGDGGEGLDFEALSRRYEEEREKRLRSDAVGQYRSLKGDLAAFDRDPNAQSQPDRDSVRQSVEAVIVGGGFGGLLTAVQLAKRGITDLAIIDKGADFGGTWYWNRYPGVRCDVESYIYVPLLEETGFVPSERYAKGAEIQHQCRLLAEKFGLYERTLFQTVARDLVWDDAERMWTVTTDRGDVLRSRFVVAATGLYSSPKLPGIPGIESFKGPSFHTSRWDYSFTGGDPDSDLPGLAGKRVGIIGTGSTGIQCVPPVARSAEHLYLFQRTPASVDVRGNGPTDVEWFRAQEEGWQRARMLNFTQWTSGIPQVEDLVGDSMTDLFREKAVSASLDMTAEEREQAEFARMERVRQRVDSIVEDRRTAEALKPYFHYFCKRPGFSDDYLQVFNRPNVTLVDTAGRGVERVTENGLVVNGDEYPLDCIIYATGFDFMTSFTRESGLTVTGRDGISLADKWSDGAHTLFGMQTRDFPNFFVLSIVQAGTSINYLHTADAQSLYMAALIDHCRQNGYATVEPTQETEDAWIEECIALSADRLAFLEKCTPSYYNFEGRRPREAELNSPYGGGPLAYFDKLEAAIEDGFEALYEFGPANA
ncbi:MAG: monooxygenase [Citromicrobium sp.]|nr:monooxygenase [Citromicrobium sp.]